MGSPSKTLWSIKMKKVLMVCILIGILASATPTFASQTSQFEIYVDVGHDKWGPWSFTATGPAVDNGIICDSGVASDYNRAPIFTQYGLIWRSTRVFECADGSGSFTLRIMSNIFVNPYSNNGNWTLQDGTGAYVGLKGNGRLTGVIDSTEYLIDVFNGVFH